MDIDTKTMKSGARMQDSVGLLSGALSRDRGASEDPPPSVDMLPPPLVHFEVQKPIICIYTVCLSVF